MLAVEGVLHRVRGFTGSCGSAEAHPLPVLDIQLAGVVLYPQPVSSTASSWISRQLWRWVGRAIEKFGDHLLQGEFMTRRDLYYCCARGWTQAASWPSSWLMIMTTPPGPTLVHWTSRCCCVFSVYPLNNNYKLSTFSSWWDRAVCTVSLIRSPPKNSQIFTNL